MEKASPGFKSFLLGSVTLGELVDFQSLFLTVKGDKVRAAGGRGGRTHARSFLPSADAHRAPAWASPTLRLGLYR